MHRVLDNTTLRATGYSRVPETGLARARVPLTGGPMVVNFSEGAGGNLRRAERGRRRAQAVGRRNHRAAPAAAADPGRLVAHYIANVRMDQHFRPTMADPGYDVSARTAISSRATDVEWEELSFSVNGTKWGPDRPPFPLLQAEKVLSLPLQLRFDSDYRYAWPAPSASANMTVTSSGSSRVGRGESLYRGTVWIDRRTFARVKVQAVQTRALGAGRLERGDPDLRRRSTTIGNRPIFLFTGLTARQIMLIAGRNLLVEKTRRVHRLPGQPAEFEGARAEARAQRPRSCTAKPTAGCATTSRRARRASSASARRAARRAMAMGVTSIRRMPSRCRSSASTISNFEFGGPDTQLAVLFAGVLAAGNIQRPKLGSTPFDASVDFFAIAVPSSDRVYDAAGEHEDERLLTWPLTTGLNLGWQYTPFQKLSGGSISSGSTATSATRRRRRLSWCRRAPSRTASAAAWEYRRGGYSVGR